MRKILSTVAACVALTVGLLGVVQPAQAAGRGQVLRNVETGLCIDRPAGSADRPVPVFTTGCDGTSSQRWVYSEASHTIRTPDTGLCLATGSSSGISVSACDGGLLVHWELTTDGRIHQLDWGIGCVDDVRSEFLTWGPCDNKANEIWSRTAA